MTSTRRRPIQQTAKHGLLNEGQRLLRHAPESTGEIARAVAVSKESVKAWRRGTRRPGYEPRRLLLVRYGIAPEAWDFQARRGAPTRAFAPQCVETHAPLLAAKAPDAQPSSTLAGVLDAAHVLRALFKRGDVTPTDLVGLVRRTRKVLELRVELERRAAREDALTVFAHPRWLSLERFIFAALKAHPAALADLRSALQAMPGYSLTHIERA